MDRFISFSLYGVDKKYRIGLLRNLDLIKSLMPSWTPIVYCSREIPEVLLSEILSTSAKVFTYSEDWHPSGLFWRFKPINDLSFSHLIFRDTDSRITSREVTAIEEWLRSGKTLHVIRDHPYHRVPIPGGLWGVTAKVRDYGIEWDKMREFGTAYGQDQEFLTRHVYRVLRTDSLVHSTFCVAELSRRKLPKRPSNMEFIGERFDERDRYVVSDRKVVAQNEVWTFKNVLRRVKISLQVLSKGYLST